MGIRPGEVLWLLRSGRLLGGILIWRSARTLSFGYVSNCEFQVFWIIEPTLIRTNTLVLKHLLSRWHPL